MCVVCARVLSVQRSVQCLQSVCGVVQCVQRAACSVQHAARTVRVSASGLNHYVGWAGTLMLLGSRPRCGGWLAGASGARTDRSPGRSSVAQEPGAPRLPALPTFNESGPCAALQTPIKAAPHRELQSVLVPQVDAGRAPPLELQAVEGGVGRGRLREKAESCKTAKVFTWHAIASTFSAAAPNGSAPCPT